MQHPIYSKGISVNYTPVKSSLNKVKLILPVLIWVAGLLLAGSDGPLMPYLNVTGAILFLCASIWLGRVLPALGEGETIKSKSIRRVKTVPKIVRRKPVSGSLSPLYSYSAI